VLAPREVSLFQGERAVGVSCGAALTAVLTETGGVQCMGLNDFGQCGVGGPTNNVWTPAPVVGLEGERVVQVRSRVG
jgi:alpha-tubulin suppressor-like RCC1 family protein